MATAITGPIKITNYNKINLEVIYSATHSTSKKLQFSLDPVPESLYKELKQNNKQQTYSQLNKWLNEIKLIIFPK